MATCSLKYFIRTLGVHGSFHALDFQKKRLVHMYAHICVVKRIAIQHKLVFRFPPTKTFFCINFNLKIQQNTIFCAVHDRKRHDVIWFWP